MPIQDMYSEGERAVWQSLKALSILGYSHRTYLNT